MEKILKFSGYTLSFVMRKYVEINTIAINREIQRDILIGVEISLYDSSPMSYNYCSVVACYAVPWY